MKSKLSFYLCSRVCSPVFKNIANLLKTQGLHTHPPVTTPPHRISWRWSRVGVVCVVCVVVGGVCGRWGLGVCGVVGCGWWRREGEGEVIFLSLLNFWKLYPLNFMFEVTGVFYWRSRQGLKKSYRLPQC